MLSQPKKVLITGGREVGGVSSFAEALQTGFAELGIPAEVISPAQVLSRWRELRDPDILKILSTTAVFAAPLARRVICVAHGFPRADMQGWIKVVAIIVSLKLAERFGQLVTVSEYAATHLRAIFALRIDAVIHNPLSPVFLEKPGEDVHQRTCITFVGRLHRSKRLHQLLPAIAEVVDETPGLRACIIGEGEQRAALEETVRDNQRIEFKGSASPQVVRHWLRQTRVFVSGCETEALGICYLEALSQGCIVAMPACGGGLEIVPEEIERSIRLLPLSLEHRGVVNVLRQALATGLSCERLDNYAPRVIACGYLQADSHRDLVSGDVGLKGIRHG